MRWHAHKSFSLPPNAAGARLSPHPVIPAVPCCHSCRPPLSFPRFLAGIQSEQVFSRIQSGVISLWQGEHDRRVVGAMVSDG